ncbi:MAG: helicase RepA family protein [Thiobacillus sp.]
MFDPIAPQVFKASPAGSRFDSSLVLPPPPAKVVASAKKLGLNLAVSLKADGFISMSAHDLTWDTELETLFGAMTVRDAVTHPEFTATGKMRCQAPFRASTSEAGFLSRGKNGRPFVHDSGTSTSHWLSDADWQPGLQTTHPEATEPVKTLLDINSYRVGRFLDSEPPPIRWILVDALPAGIVGIVVAPGGTGKSWWLIQMGVSVATGMALAGTWEIGSVGGVLMFLAEDDEAQLHRRLFHLVEEIPVSQRDAVVAGIRKNLFIASRVAENNLLTSGDPYSKEVQQTQLVDQLIATARQIPELQLIVFDPASRFRGGDENASQDATRFVEALERVAKATGATVLVAHHSNKGAFNTPEQTQSASRGSSALTDGVRWQMNLMTFSAADAKNYAVPPEDKGFYLTATITKNNYAAPQAPTSLKRGNGGYLGKADLISTAKLTADSLSVRIVDLVKSELKAGHGHSKTAFTNQFSGEGGALRTGNNKVRDAVNELVAAGKLRLDRHKKLALPLHVIAKKSR